MHLARASDGRGRHCDLVNLRRRGRNPSDLTCMQSHCWMRNCLPFGHHLPGLSRWLDRGHSRANPTTSGRPHIHYVTGHSATTSETPVNMSTIPEDYHNFADI